MLATSGDPPPPPRVLHRAGRQTDRQTGRGRQTDRQTDGQTDIHRQQQRGRYERGRLADGRGVLLPCLPVKRATLTGVEVRHGERRPIRRHDGYSYPKAIYYLRTSTRAPHVSAAPVRCRKVVYPGGCTARPGS